VGRIDVGLREHPAAPHHRHLLRIDVIVCGLAAVEGLHVEGMTQHDGKTRLSSEISQPVPGEETFPTDNEVLPIGRNSLEQRFGSRLHIPVQDDLPIPLQDAEIHATGRQSDAAVKLVWLGVESQEVSSSSEGCLPNASIPRRYAEEGASISINPVERTAPSGSFISEACQYLGAAAHRERSTAENLS
jgi:hypothetical protein